MRTASLHRGHVRRAPRKTSRGRKPNAIDKALAVLDILIGHPEGLRPVELGRLGRYPHGTLHRLLGTLGRNEFVRQDSNGRYVLGYKFVRAFSAIAGGSRLQEKALPQLRRAAEATGHAANLGVLRGDQVVYLESIVAGNGGLVMYSPPGTLRPVHCTALGKVILAHRPAGDLARTLKGLRYAAITPSTIRSGDDLLLHLADVREQGYALDREESERGITCVAAPVRNHMGEVVAGISISAPIQMLPAKRIPSVVKVMVEAARVISTDLGYDRSLTGEAAAK